MVVPPSKDTPEHHCWNQLPASDQAPSEVQNGSAYVLAAQVVAVVVRAEVLVIVLVTVSA